MLLNVKLVALASFVFLFVLSCSGGSSSSKDKNAQVNTSKRCTYEWRLVSNVLESGSKSGHYYVYSVDNLLTNINKKSAETGTLLNESKYSYTGKDLTLVEYFDYTKGGKLSFTNKYFYNDKGQLIRGFDTMYADKGVVSSTEEQAITYDTNSRVSVVTETEKDGSNKVVMQEVLSYQYGDKGIEKIERKVKVGTRSSSEKIFAYNAKGQIIKTHNVSKKDNSIFDIQKYEYDTNGNASKEVFQDSSTSTAKPAGIFSWEKKPTPRQAYEDVFIGPSQSACK